MTVTTPGVLRVAPHVGAVATDTGYAVAQLRRSTIHVLDDTAGAIWAGIARTPEEPPGLDALVATLAEDYSVPADAIRESVVATVDRFVELGLVTVDAPS